MPNCNCNSIYILLCFRRFSPLALEITCSILCIIGGITTYFGLLGIPFHIDSNINKIFFFINIPYFIVMILLNIVFLFLRYKDLINNELHLWGYGLSIIEIYIALFGVITSLINDSIIISNMRYYQEISLIKKSSKYPMITHMEWLYTKTILPIILFIWVNMLLIALSDNILINLKINGSYQAYEEALEQENRNIERHNPNNGIDEENYSQERTNRNLNNNQKQKSSFINKIKKILIKIKKTSHFKLKRKKDNITKKDSINIKINNNINNDNEKDKDKNKENDKNINSIKTNNKNKEIASSVNVLITEDNNMEKDLKENEVKNN